MSSLVFVSDSVLVIQSPGGDIQFHRQSVGLQIGAKQGNKFRRRYFDRRICRMDGVRISEPETKNVNMNNEYKMSPPE